MIERRESSRAAGTIKEVSGADTRSPRCAGKGSWHGGQIIMQQACPDGQLLSFAGNALTAVIPSPLFEPSWMWTPRPSCADAGSPCMRKVTAPTISNVRILSICSRIHCDSSVAVSHARTQNYTAL